MSGETYELRFVTLGEKNHCSRWNAALIEDMSESKRAYLYILSTVGGGNQN